MTKTCDCDVETGEGSVDGDGDATGDGDAVASGVGLVCSCAEGRAHAPREQIDNIRAATLVALTWLELTIARCEIAWRSVGSDCEPAPWRTHHLALPRRP